MGRKNRRKKIRVNKITTKNAISKSELREARLREEIEAKQTIPSEPKANNDNMEAAKMTEIYDLTGSKVDNSTIVDSYKDGYGVTQLADIYEVDDETILSILICDSYITDELTIKECTDKYNVTKYFVTKILKENDVHMRPRGYNRKEPDKLEVVEDNKEAVEIPTVIEAENKPDKSTFIFCGQEYHDTKLNRVSFGKYSQDIVVAGLCKNRHDMPVSKYIFDTLSEKEIDDPKYIESRALGFINAYVKPKLNAPAKTLVLYCTGFALALSTIIKVCIENKINLITMHYNPVTDSYLPQNTIDIFGKLPPIDDISPLRNLKDRYKGGVFLYGCKNKHLIERDQCLFISLHDDIDHDKDVIIIFARDFPAQDIWKFYGDMIKLSRNDGFEKRQNIQMGTISISMSGYIWGDILSKSYNWRSERTDNKR